VMELTPMAKVSVDEGSVVGHPVWGAYSSSSTTDPGCHILLHRNSGFPASQPYDPP
jgi:hypothetical protein